MSAPPYAATEQHIRLIQAKRVKLTAALIDAQEQYITAVAREFATGTMLWSELLRAYGVIRDSGLPGYGARWQAVIPHTVHHIKRMAAIDEVEEWSGTGMDVYLDPGRPPKGACVVYLLCDEAGHPIYTGSTENFTSRTSHHRRDKTWASWRAYRCRDRAHAYEVERRFLQQYKPSLNKQGARSA